ncbi:hypothetical protein V5O48_003614 [Marasmius crinis-equi]|uniref:FAD-binding domain-containing protein n=1 Tax=Marasmius crinis-equi TaxID=585013 RepID=A0ABR3FSF5_9AGAR
MSSNTLTADVVIVGGGPVGSLLAYQLARFGCRPYLIEQEDKTGADCYGRGCTLWPRTVELLDQLGLAEGLLQSGMITRSGMHFQKGRRMRGGIMYGSRMDRLGDTFFKFALHLRQKLTEGRFAAALEQQYGLRHHNRHLIESYTIHDTMGGDYPINVRVRDLSNDRVFDVKTKYLIGADGGKSTVRKLAGIPFDGENTKHRWIRMDARVKTNMPNARCLNSIDSDTHGQILWCPNDDGLTRIGYVFSSALLEKYGGAEGVTQEVAMEEAKKALHPFELEFISVDWFTIYLRIHGLAQPSILDSYDSERRPLVQKVIDNDKIISLLISGQTPPRFQDRQETPREILTEWFDDMNMQAFTLGLGITYPINPINREFTGPCRATINPGERGPDVYLSTIGTGDPIRLHKILQNDGKFSLVVFAGIPAYAQSMYTSFKMAVHGSFLNVFPARIFKWFTISSIHGNGGQEILGTQPLGRVYFDESVRAHEMYGIDVRLGAVVVFRPDGWVGTVVEMNEKGVKDLVAYFDEILEKNANRCAGIVPRL